MDLVRSALSVFGKMGMLIAIAAAFVIGLLGTLYFSFHSSEVSVPSVVGKSRSEGETLLEESGLNMRQRATRYNPDVQPNTILEQTPKPGDVVKAGQFIAVVLSRPVAIEGETSVPVAGQEQNTKSDSENTESSENENTSGENENAKPVNNNTNRPKNRNTNVNKNKNQNNTNNRNTNNTSGKNTNNVNNRNSNNRNSTSVPGNPRTNVNRRPPN